MLFFEYSFIFIFLPVVLGGYYLIPQRMRNLWLLVASCAFYSATSLFFLPILLLSTCIDYYCGKRLSCSNRAASRKFWLVCSVVSNLSILGFFKYAQMISQTLHLVHSWQSIPVIDVMLPVGISFYTFQSMSYTIDLYRRQAQPARSLVNFATYVTLFPQLIAGPIVRFREIHQQLDHRTHSWRQFAEGIEFFVVGLSKKILLADFAAWLCDPMIDAASPRFVSAWVAMGLYSMQIYFDFSGYSDMAVGLGKMLGFEFPQNFNSPYRAISFSDFWRRWHMTLSRWLRDNLYFPLGGNRKGPMRTYVNLMVTMLLGGLWHGAAWKYVTWGAYHGALLAIERCFPFNLPKNKLLNGLRIGFVFAAVTLGWVFFRCKDMVHAQKFLEAMFFNKGLGTVPLDELAVLAGMLGIVFIHRNSWQQRGRFGWMRTLLLLGYFVMSLLVAYGAESSPFLYFRF